MTNKFNPQLKIEMVKLLPDGSEEPMNAELIPTDLNHHAGNKPVKCEVNIQKSLGSAQNTASITIHNAPIIETIRRDYRAFLESIRDQNWRVRIWAWWSDSREKTEPDYAPVFQGDIFGDFGVSADSINDSSLTLKANGHDHLMRSGKLRREYATGVSWREIVEDIFDYYQNELQIGKKIIIQDAEDLLGQKILLRPFVINTNSINILNDFCRHLDMVWGIDGSTFYILKRTEYFTNEQLPEIFNEPIARASERTGKISLSNFGRYTFGFSSLFDNEFSLGKPIRASDFPQIGFNEPLFGRINSININLNNYDGHTSDLDCQYVLEDEQKVLMPPMRDDFSGRRL